MSEVTPFEAVEEFHGPYGPYHVSELVLQKIWLEQAFDQSRLVDERGRRVEVVYPGTWNRLEGPDFRDATLLIDGEEIVGDVEVHFSQADWRSHGHASDEAYDRVVLHVLYFDPGEGAPVSVTSKGSALPRVVLLPILWYSLEEYAGEDSLIASTGVDLRPEVESLLQLDLATRKARLVELAKRRWQMKRHFAGLRIERLGWQVACHQSALEVLGFARNRIPMLMVAERFALEDFSGVDCELGAMFDVGEERWRLSGCRPANHPKARLRQYADWAAAVPDWPARLGLVEDAVSNALVPVAEGDWGSQDARAQLDVKGLRSLLLARVIGEKIGGTRLDTLLCDALLPLLSAQAGIDCYSVWFHWPAGDRPESCVEALKLLQVLEPRRVPLCNGWLQGALGAKSLINKGERAVHGFQAHA